MGEGRATMTELCANCRTPLVAITLDVVEGTRTLLSCSRCDRRVWVADGGPIDLSGVLADLSDRMVKRAEAGPR
jgi:hypothetical protein